MKIVCISDTHALHHHTSIPAGEMLIFAGDFSAAGEMDVLKDFNEWLGKLPHKYKIVIAGNHDFCFENEPNLAQSLLSNAIYLHNSGVTIEGLKIWGSPISPISPRFGEDWAFNKKRGEEIREYWEMIPTDTDILITHCPPWGILDKNDWGSNEGCKDLLAIVQIKVKPRVHIFGHIHESYGQIQLNGTSYINASMVGLRAWINNYQLMKYLRTTAIRLYLPIKSFLRKNLKQSKAKVHLNSLSKWHWEVKNQAIVIEIVP